MEKIKCPECGKNGHLSGVVIEPANNGAKAEMRFEHKRSGQGGGPDVDYHRYESVHPSMAHAVNHLKQKVGKSAWGQEGPQNEGPGGEGEAGEAE